MEIVLLTAMGVGGAAIIGAGVGFIFKNISHKFSDIVLSFAAGVGFGSGDTSQALIIAGGTMLYVISDEMIPETHAHGCERGATYTLLIGFCIMLITDVLLG